MATTAATTATTGGKTAGGMCEIGADCQQQKATAEQLGQSQASSQQVPPFCAMP